MTNAIKHPERLALLSVSDKTGIIEFANGLRALGFTLLSTGGTAQALRKADIDVRDVSTHTGFPEIMDGRVKTLHPKIHGGILARVQDSDVAQQHDIDLIELVVVNLYPFAEVTRRADCSFEEAIENIDIGGPAMLRAAAKNHARVNVVTRPEDYARVLESLQKNSGSGSDPELRAALARRAFAHTAAYDAMVADYLTRQTPAENAADDGFALPQTHTPLLQSAAKLRYGENPHQAAALYRFSAHQNEQPADWKQLQGKALSYNNIADADAALETVGQFQNQAACIIVKHANPCGGATAASLAQAYEHAYATDPVSAFGGIIAFSGELDADTAERILARQFVEVIIAPSFAPAALTCLAAKPNIRVLATGAFKPQAARLDYQRVANGMLIQQHDALRSTRENCRSVARIEPSESQWADMLFAWKMARMVKSNAIVYARDSRTLGVGAGQMSRVDSARIGAWKAADAGLDLQQAVMASDAFFPFRDSIDTAADAGISAIIQPGGSMRDEEVIAAANEHGMAMVLTGVRHFRH